MATTDISPCRAVTSKEVTHYKEKGWVQLKRFIAPEMLEKMLAKAIGIMGEDGDSNPPYGIDQPYFNAQLGNGYADPGIRPVFAGIGRTRATVRRASTRITSPSASTVRAA
jgi:hypothetical protein